ncbi:hypothetical protein BGZ97_013224 [Linnemannia gamsii]|uniref:F-box domain-containing protein n=1 Tax=Linnemannia gamsii TaxID=64522 RepID=A0A9P6R3M1_9FUNG|nr:hypothetical protein BGZ97_013224 [Linnemannia gamsii]
MAPNPMTTRALDMPEIKARIASFLNNKDRISCMLVSRDWCRDFAGAVWHTVIFEKDESFTKIPLVVISKYGHLIHHVLKVAKEQHILALQDSNITSLKSIDFLGSNNKLSLALFSDLVRNHKHSLTSLTVSGELIETPSFVEQRNVGMYLPSDALGPGTSLTTISLERVCVTRSAFSAILKSSPSLRSLSLRSTMILAYNPTQELFQHRRLTNLKASSHQVLNYNSMLPRSPSLLVHFPSLEVWEIVHALEAGSPASMSELRQELSGKCPNLKGVVFAGIIFEHLSGYLDHVFRRLRRCTFPYQSLDTTVLLSLLEHQVSLTSIVMTEPYWIGPSDNDEIPSSKKMIGLLLRSCRGLEVLSVKGHQMDVDYLEDQEVVCDGLQELRIRFQGLETVDAVDDFLVHLCAMKKLGPTFTDKADKSKGSVRGRICRQLMRFTKLKTVWLGTRDCYLPSR